MLADAPETIKSPFGVLIAASDEAGFAARDVESLCRSAVSSKTNQFTEHTGTLGDRAQYSMRSSTGEKGIGFKSMFGHVSSPHIFSRHFRFRFKPKSAENPLHVVTPYWVDDPTAAAWARDAVSSISGGALSPDDGHGTILVLPLATAQVYDVVSASLRESIETDTMIIFLRKVRSINTHILVANGDPWHASYEIQDLTPLSLLGELDAALPLAYPSPAPLLHHFGAKLIELIGCDSQSEARRSSHWLLAEYHYGIPKDVLDAERDQQSDREVPASQGTPIGIALPLNTATQRALRTTGRIYTYLPTGMGNTNWPALVNAGFSLVTSRESLDPNKPRNAFLLQTALIHAYSIAFRALADALIASPHEDLADIAMETRLELVLGAFPMAGSHAFLNSRLDALAEMLVKLAWVPCDASSNLRLLSDVMIAPKKVCDLFRGENEVVAKSFAHSDMLSAHQAKRQILPQLVLKQLREWGVSDWVSVLSKSEWIALPRHTDEWRVRLIQAVRDAALLNVEVGRQVLAKDCRWLPTTCGGVRSYAAVVHLLCNDQDRAFDKEGLILAPVRHVVDAKFWKLLEAAEGINAGSVAAWLQRAGFAKRFDRVSYLKDVLQRNPLPCSGTVLIKLVNDALHTVCCDESGGVDLKPILNKGVERKLYLNRGCEPVVVSGTYAVMRPVNVCSTYQDLFDWPAPKYGKASAASAHFKKFVLHSDYLDVSENGWRKHRQTDMLALANYLFGTILPYDGKPGVFANNQPTELFPFLSEKSVDRGTFGKLVSWVAEKSATSDKQIIAAWAELPWILRQGDNATLHSPRSLLHLDANSDLAAAFAPIYGPNAVFSDSSAASQMLPLPYYEYFGSVSPTVVGVPAWSKLSLMDCVSVLLKCWQENATNFDVVDRLVKVLHNRLKSFTSDETYSDACQAVLDCLSENALVPVGSDRTLLRFDDSILLPPDRVFYQHALWDHMLTTESCPIVLWTRGMLGPDKDDLLRRVCASMSDISQSQLLTLWGFVAENISVSSDATTEISSVETFIWSLIHEVLSEDYKESLKDMCVPFDGQWLALGKLCAFDSAQLKFGDTQVDLLNIYHELYAKKNIFMMSRESVERCREGIEILVKSGKHVIPTSETIVLEELLTSLYNKTQEDGADLPAISAIAWQLYAHIGNNFNGEICQLLCSKFVDNKLLILSNTAISWGETTNIAADQVQKIEDDLKSNSSRKVFQWLCRRNMPTIIKDRYKNDDSGAKRVESFFFHAPARPGPIIKMYQLLVERLRTTNAQDMFTPEDIEEVSWKLIKVSDTYASSWPFVYHRQEWIKPATAVWINEDGLKDEITRNLEYPEDTLEEKKTATEERKKIGRVLEEVMKEVCPSNLWRTAHKYYVSLTSLNPLKAKPSTETFLAILSKLRSRYPNPSGPVASVVWGIVAALVDEKRPLNQVCIVHNDAWVGLPAPHSVMWMLSPYSLPDVYEPSSSSSTSDGLADVAQSRRKEFARSLLWRASSDINWGASASSAGLSLKSASMVASYLNIAERKPLPSSCFIKALRLLAQEANVWVAKMRADHPKVLYSVLVDFIYNFFTWLAAKAGDEEVKKASSRMQTSPLCFPTLGCRRFVSVDRLVIGSEADHNAKSFKEASDAKRFILGITIGHLPDLLSSFLGAIALDKVPAKERLILDGSLSIVPFDDPSWPSLFISDHLARILEALASTWFPDVARVVSLFKSTELVECDELSRVVTYDGIGSLTFVESSRLLPSESFISEYEQLGRSLPMDFKPLSVECRGTEPGDALSMPSNSPHNRLVVARDDEDAAAFELAERILALKAPSLPSDMSETPDMPVTEEVRASFRREVVRWFNQAIDLKDSPLNLIQEQVERVVKILLRSAARGSRSKKNAKNALSAAALEGLPETQDGTTASPPMSDAPPPTTETSPPEPESLKQPQSMAESSPAVRKGQPVGAAEGIETRPTEEAIYTNPDARQLIPEPDAITWPSPAVMAPQHTESPATAPKPQWVQDMYQERAPQGHRHRPRPQHRPQHQQPQHSPQPQHQQPQQRPQPQQHQPWSQQEHQPQRQMFEEVSWPTPSPYHPLGGQRSSNSKKARGRGGNGWSGVSRNGGGGGSQQASRSTHSGVSVSSLSAAVGALSLGASPRALSAQQPDVAPRQSDEWEEYTFDNVDVSMFQRSFAIVAPPSLAPSTSATFQFGATSNPTPRPFAFSSKYVGGRPPTLRKPEGQPANVRYTAGSVHQSSSSLAQIVGAWGEEYALETILPEMFPQSRILGTGGNNHSHDILVYSQDDKLECIVEVKVTTSGNSFAWSGAQIEIARTQGEKYLLLIIVPKAGQVIPIRDPFAWFQSGQMKLTSGRFKLG